MNQTQFNFPTKQLSPKVKNWLRLIETGEFRNKTVVVLRHIYECKFGTTVHHLRNATGFPHQTLTAVLSNLMDAGIVGANGETFIGESYFSILHFIHDDAMRTQLSEERNWEKFRLWVKRGLEEFEQEMSVTLMSALQMEK